MKYICLGYYDEKRWATMSESESNSVIDACFAYEDTLRKNGHFANVEVCNPRDATTIRSRNGQVSITDGPYTETKEQLGAIVILEATDLNHAVQLMSNHPGVKYGSIFDIRPAGDMTEMVRESERRRAGRK
jgi:hypothetical protein